MSQQPVVVRRANKPAHKANLVCGLEVRPRRDLDLKPFLAARMGATAIGLDAEQLSLVLHPGKLPILSFGSRHFAIALRQRVQSLREVD
jgi:hypothetical protein